MSIRFENCWKDIGKRNLVAFGVFDFYIIIDRFTGDCEIGFSILGIGLVVKFTYSKEKRAEFEKMKRKLGERRLRDGIH